MSLTSAVTAIGNLPTNQLASGAAILGVLSHWTYFIHDERDRQAWEYLLTLIGTPPVLVSLVHFSGGKTIGDAGYIIAVATGSFLVALYGSIIVYRLWFHPLRKFPGPPMARLTKVYYAYKYSQSKGRYYEVQKEWFAKYGNVVRTGPNEITTIDPNALQVLSKTNKGTWYVFGEPTPSIQLVRDITTHSIRRRVWDKALSAKAIEGYLPHIRRHISLLLPQLAGEVDISRFFSYYAFDTMGVITYGRSFNMLEKAGRDGSDYFLRMTHASMRTLGLLAHIPWTLVLLENLGAAGKDHTNFLKWCDEISQERKQRGKGDDIFGVLLDVEPQNVGQHHIPLAGDSRTAIVAGSDTTASTLISLIAYLCSEPLVRQKLQEDVDKHGAESEYLEACINEALRLNPAVPSGTPRYSPPEGLVLEDGRRVPGGINMLFPLHAAQRDPRWFDSPEEFLPERWINPGPEQFARMNTVFQPFWVGRYQCAGKALAMTQLKMVTAAVVQKYAFHFKEGWTIERAMEGAIDTFTMEMKSVWCVFSERI
ncbi:cytochrome P450 [Pyronema domesticum]|nr:cytochrome P450 [Pyronema domesticum]